MVGNSTMCTTWLQRRNDISLKIKHNLSFVLTPIRLGFKSTPIMSKLANCYNK